MTQALRCGVSAKLPICAGLCKDGDEQSRELHGGSIVRLCVEMNRCIEMYDNEMILMRLKDCELKNGM